jgi:hypothetical protein
MIACDPQMCSALARGGFPPGQMEPLANSHSLAGASLIAVTPRVRQGLTANPRVGADVAPVLLASFGSGRALVTIQPIDPSGGTAYQAELTQDVQERIQVGQQLLNSGQVSAAPKAKRALAAGRVDARLLLVIKAIIQVEPVKIAGFNDAGPGASVSVPYRRANLVGTDLAAGKSPAQYMQAIVSVLKAHASFPPIPYGHGITMADGQTGIQIMYFAPSPLGLLAGG